jgi:ribosomal protein S18 acetylase RimI-like enzyme
MIIREYRPADFGRLYEIDHAAFAPALAYSRSELRYYVQARRGKTLVAETDGEVAGFVIARCAQRSWGTIVTLDVAPSRQRQGIGRRLMAAIEEWLAGEGVRVVSLETPADESGARQFYEKDGYLLGNLMRGYYNGRLDAYAMFKRLTPAGPGAAAIRSSAIGPGEPGDGVTPEAG